MRTKTQGVSPPAPPTYFFLKEKVGKKNFSLQNARSIAPRVLRTQVLFSVPFFFQEKRNGGPGAKPLVKEVLIVDYFKGSGEGSAFDSYQELGHFVDLLKDQICGDMNIAGSGVAQATASGKLADSAKIARNASTIATITDKTPEEIEVDGAECGNKKLRVIVNRNGMQMAQGEYIDLLFDGNHILYEQAKQHIPRSPY